jgi:hypothetical protein
MKVLAAVIGVAAFQSATAADTHHITNLRMLSTDELLEQCVASCTPPHVKAVRTSLCKQYSKIRPQPKMFRVCDMGVRSIYTDSCELACSYNVEESTAKCAGLSNSDWMKDIMSQQCDKYSEMLPRPLL